jgi:hypothetical protein
MTSGFLWSGSGGGALLRSFGKGDHGHRFNRAFRGQSSSIEIVYSTAAPNSTTFTQIDAILSGLIGAVGGCYTAAAIR